MRYLLDVNVVIALASGAKQASKIKYIARISGFSCR